MNLADRNRIFPPVSIIIRQQIRKENSILKSLSCHEKHLTWLSRFINFTKILLPNLKLVNFNSQMRVNFNRFSINSQRWKYAILTGNFYLIRICSIFLQILQKRSHLKDKSVVFQTVKELFLCIKY